jgi:hypothetical protein
MALVLTLKEGQDFFVEEVRFVVEEVLGPLRFRLSYMREVSPGEINVTQPRSVEITDARATEVLPDVLVSAGWNAPSAKARVVIEAPAQILILRGDTKRNRALQNIAQR